MEVQKLQQRYLRAFVLRWGLQSWESKATKVWYTQSGWWAGKMVDLLLNWWRLSFIFVCSIWRTAVGAPCQAIWSTLARSRHYGSIIVRMFGRFQSYHSLLRILHSSTATMGLWSLVKQLDIQTGKTFNTSPANILGVRTHPKKVRCAAGLGGRVIHIYFSGLICIVLCSLDSQPGVLNRVL